MKTKVRTCFYCIYNDTGEAGGNRDEEKGICFRCENFSNQVDMRTTSTTSTVATIEWPIEDELIGRGDPTPNGD